MLRVALAYNDDRGLGSAELLDSLAVEGVREAASAVGDALRGLGHLVLPIPVRGSPEGLISALRTAAPDVVFNLVESINGDARLEAAAAHLYRWLELPFTGSDPATLSLALDKGRTKAVLAAAGIPTPRGGVLESAADLAPLSPPYMVKPLRLDASHGIDAGSVTADAEAALARAAEIRRKYGQPALVEEYIEGRELNVSMLYDGHTLNALSPGEIDFSGLPKDSPRILTYAAKWEPGSPEYGATPAVAAAEVPPRVLEVARAAFLALELHGYGRVDLRLHPARGPFVLEVNPNPDLSLGAGFQLAAARSNLSYEALIAKILAAALDRDHNPRASAERS
ncbi:MAG: ATP-grasp domain-containing protein [Myxococcota bacterium]